MVTFPLFSVDNTATIMTEYFLHYGGGDRAGWGVGHLKVHGDVSDE